MSRLQESMISGSFSRFKMSHSDLIDKILALEDTLYSANLQNQELRQRRTRLQHQLQSKKAQLYCEPIQVKTTRSKLLSRNNSQPNVNFQTYSDSDSVSATQSSGLMSIQPRLGNLITGNQPSFQRLKLGESQECFQQSKLSTVSSPRTVGIRKNVKKAVMLQTEESVNLGFKTIQQLWNGRQGETFLKKTSQKPTHKGKKSYLT